MSHRSRVSSPTVRLAEHASWRCACTTRRFTPEFACDCQQGTGLTTHCVA